VSSFFKNCARIVSNSVNLHTVFVLLWPTRKRFVHFLWTLFREDLLVYARKPFGGPEHVLHYLARYTHRSRFTEPMLLLWTDRLTGRGANHAHAFGADLLE
jgi:hypothetical protein